MSKSQDPMQALGLDTEQVNVEIPTCMDVSPDENGGNWTVNLYADGCLNCSSLVQDAADDYTNAKCHFSQGNQYCPAFQMRIAFVGRKVLAIKRIKEAQHKGDSQALLRQLTKLAELSETDRRAILEECGLKVFDPEPEPQVQEEPLQEATQEGTPPEGTTGEVEPPDEEEVTEVDC